ncbi:MAG: hypothetical protein J6R68_03960 [Clostridia bacterium]|nr:hypothetical protein [Clostridia bacterium]
MKKFFSKIFGWVKLHKVVSIMLSVLIIATAVALPILLCREDNSIKKPVALANDECLVVGEHRFINNEITNRTIVKETLILKNVYTLRRQNYEPYSGIDFVKINEYYYYWETTTTTTEIEIGTLVTTTKTKYSYLPYKENQEILVMREATESKEYYENVEGGWKSNTFQYEIKLSGFYASFNTLKEAQPALAELINTTGVEKYYVETEFPNRITNTSESFNTYYYIEKI